MIQNSRDDVTLRKQLDQTARDLEEGVGACVDEFRALGNVQENEDNMEVSSVSGDDDRSVGSAIFNGGGSTSPNRERHSTILKSLRSPTMSNSQTTSPNTPSSPTTLSPSSSVSVVGGPLDLVMKRQREHSPALKVPIFFRQIINYIRKSGRYVEMLFCI